MSLNPTPLRGLELSGRFYREVVRPLLDAHFPGLRHAAALIGGGVGFYLLAAGWARIGQEEHLMGRAGSVGDDVGAALIASRLVRDSMRLCFLMERQYAPYPKWFGTAFKQLACSAEMWPLLRAAQVAPIWQEAEAALVGIYEQLARMHNRLQLTPPMPEQARRFFGRPFRVIALHGFADALLREIRDPDVTAIVAGPRIGSVDLFSDNTDLLESIGLRRALRGLFGNQDDA